MYVRTEHGARQPKREGVVRLIQNPAKKHACRMGNISETVLAHLEALGTATLSWGRSGVPSHRSLD